MGARWADLGERRGVCEKHPEEARHGAALDQLPVEVVAPVLPAGRGYRWVGEGEAQGEGAGAVWVWVR